MNFRDEPLKALVFHHPELKVGLEEIPAPKLGENPYAPEDVIVESKFCGICGSDIHIWSGNLKPPVAGKFVYGHEFSGIVHGVGDEVKDFKLGDRVTCETRTFYCGKCLLCRTGKTHICRNGKPFYFSTGGAFAKYAVFPARHLHRIPENVSLEEACLIEPASSAVRAVVERANVSAGDSVAIFGPGTIGLMNLQIAKACGASPVIVMGTSADKERLKLAKEFEADYTMNVQEGDIVKKIMKITDGMGVDVSIEAAGSRAAMMQALDVIRRGGTVIVMGLGYQIPELDTAKLVLDEITLKGSVGHTYTSWKHATKLISEGKIKVKPLISRILPLSDWRNAFELAKKGEGIKLLLRID